MTILPTYLPTYLISNCITKTTTHNITTYWSIVLLITALYIITYYLFILSIRLST